MLEFYNMYRRDFFLVKGLIRKGILCWLLEITRVGTIFWLSFPTLLALVLRSMSGT